MKIPAARDFGGSIPEYYDRYMGPAQFEAFGADLVRRLPAKPPGDVLEIACGTGIVTRRLRERLDPAVRLVATDLSRAMLDYARAKLAKSPGIEWQEADAAALPFADAAFGAVVCAFGIMFVLDKPSAFRQMRRVLREGGVLLFNVWDSIDENAHARASDEVVSSLFPGDPELQLATLPYGFHDPRQIRALLAEADFRELRIEKARIEIRSPSVRAYATGLIKGTPRSTLLQQRGASLDEVIKKLAIALARIGGDEPFRCPAQALVVEAQAI